MTKSNPTSIRLSQEVYERVVAEATKEKRSISAQIEYIIEKYYEIKKSMKD